MAKTLLIGIWGLAGFFLVKGYPVLSLVTLGGLYALHLRTYPNKTCNGCRGGNVYSGFLRTTSYRCGKCGGTGRLKRVGAALVERRR